MKLIIDGGKLPKKGSFNSNDLATPKGYWAMIDLGTRRVIFHKDRALKKLIKGLNKADAVDLMKSQYPEIPKTCLRDLYEFMRP